MKRLTARAVDLLAKVGNWLLGEPDPDFLAQRDAVDVANDFHAEARMRERQLILTYAVEAMVEEREADGALALDFHEWAVESGWAK